MTKQCDIAVIGAGPAGANAAISAAQAGCRVILLDEQRQAGGQVWRAKDGSILNSPPTPETKAGNALRARVADSAIDHQGDSRVWHIEKIDEGWRVHILTGGHVNQIIARALILAGGAREFVQPVPGWTTPGVIGLAGATVLLKQSMNAPGKQTVISGTGPLVFFVASEIRRLGGQVAAIVTANRRRDWMRALPSMLARPDLIARGVRWMADLMKSGVPIYWGHAVSRVSGGDQLRRLEIVKLDGRWFPVRKTREIAADSLCLGNGLIPATEIAQLAGVAIEHRPDLGGWVPVARPDGETDVAGVFVCGDGAGIRGAAAAEIQGMLAGLKAAAFLGVDVGNSIPRAQVRYRRAARFGAAMTALSIPRPGLSALATDDTIICRCEGITRAALSREIADGADSTNAVKSGSRAGMGPCGGRFCQISTARLIALTKGCAESDVPPPVSRPPLCPVPLNALAGEFDYAELPIPKPAPL